MHKNHWQLKDSEVKQLVNDYAIELSNGYDRKEAIRKVIDFEKRLAAGDIVTDDKKSDYVEQLKKKEPRLRLTKVIFHNTRENDLPYIFVGHNGRGYYIPKETEVDVPDYILNSCIKDAIEDRLLPETQMNGDIKWVIRKLQRFPYTIVKPSFEAGSEKD